MITFQDFFETKKEELLGISEMTTTLINLNESNIYETEKLINKSVYVQSKEAMYRFLSSLNAVIVSRPQILSLYCRLIGSITNQIKKYFCSEELVLIFSNKKVVLSLIEEKLIDVQTLINFHVDRYDILCYFCEEIQSKNKRWLESQKEYHPELAEFMKHINIKEHHKKRMDAVNDDEFANAIYNDDVTKFQDLIAATNQSLNSPLFDSVYESSGVSKCAKFIEYAAFCQSINIFKFLWMNNADKTFKLLQMAICGGNYDIIHICEELRFDYDQECLKMAIKFHRNEIVHYLIDSFGVAFNLDCLFESVRSFNYEIFCEFATKTLKDVNEKINDTTILHVACQCGNYDVAYILSQIPDINPNVRDKNRRTPLHYAARAGYMNIVKCLVKYTRINIEARDQVRVSNFFIVLQRSYTFSCTVLPSRSYQVFNNFEKN